MEVAGMPRHAQEQARDAKKKVQVTVVFPDPTVFDRLEAEAARKGLAVSGLIRMYAMERLEQEERARQEGRRW
jgi:hypothetical protein